MAILNKLRKSRAEARSQAKAAKSKVKAEVKKAEKAEKRREKLLAKQENALIKAEEKGLKRKRKHQKKMAEIELNKARAGRFNARTVTRYAGAARMLAPLALPLIYRGATALRELAESRQAARAGVSTSQLAEFSGYGAPLKARTQGIRNSLDDADLKPGFKRDVRDRLDEIDAAVDNAEYMTPQQRGRAHQSITLDIDKVTQEIQEALARTHA